MPQSSLTAWLQKPAERIDQRAEMPHEEIQRPIPSTAALASAAVSTPPPLSPPPPPPTIAQTSGVAPSTTETSTAKPFGCNPLSPPQNVELRACTKSDIPQLKRLTSLLLPIPYSEHFFRETIQDPIINSVTLLALWHDDPLRRGIEKGRLVGAIRCRVLPDAPASRQWLNGGLMDNNDGAPRMLYLSTLILLSPYRGHGVATHLLQAVTRRAIEDYGVASIGAHVWEANRDGLSWYDKRGFREVTREPGYYPRLSPSGAVVMRREVRVTDLLCE